MKPQGENEKKHPEWLSMSVYENTELLPVAGRIVWIFCSVGAGLNFAAGYILSTHRDSPWAQEIVSFVLGLSHSFATRFADLQSLTQTGGYYYVETLVVLPAAGVIMSVALLASYFRITFWSKYAAPFNPASIKGVVASIMWFVVMFWAFFSLKMDTGPYMGIERALLPPYFPVLAIGVAFFLAIPICQAVVIVMKFIYLRKGKDHE